MRWQPGRSPEEGTSLSAADARRRTIAGRCRGRRCRRGSLFAASAGSSAVPPSSPPPSPSSSDGTRTSWTGGTANTPAGVHLSGLVSVGTGHLWLNNYPRWLILSRCQARFLAERILALVSNAAASLLPLSVPSSSSIRRWKKGRMEYYIEFLRSVIWKKSCSDVRIVNSS